MITQRRRIEKMAGRAKPEMADHVQERLLQMAHVAQAFQPAGSGDFPVACLCGQKTAIKNSVKMRPFSTSTFSWCGLSALIELSILTQAAGLGWDDFGTLALKVWF